MSAGRSCLGIGFFSMCLVLPIPIFLIGLIGWSLETGLIAGLVSFTLMLMTSIILITTTKDPGWLAASLPFVAASVYMILPDFIIGGFDDTAVMFAGVFGTSVLIFRKLGYLPVKVVLPLIIASIYPIFGQFLPVPVDELFVALICSAGAVLGVTFSKPIGQVPAIGKEEIHPLIEAKLEEDGFEDETIC